WPEAGGAPAWAPCLPPAGPAGGPPTAPSRARGGRGPPAAAAATTTCAADPAVRGPARTPRHRGPLPTGRCGIARPPWRPLGSLCHARVVRPTLFEFPGGEPAFLALATAPPPRCLRDPQRNPPSS